ncbi:ABC transporter ATP-binding protein [Sutcliffiella horikoshii]|uniref:ABC transporter ATP-binding protein n=1 Tax=Sutcliffiella horikoshii TaxID=79883 RepID=UPI00384DF471
MMSFINGTESKKVVLEAKGLGVSFDAGFAKDDYKSHIIDLIKGKKSPKEEAEFWPIRNIDFKGYQGEILGLIGSNGSGKTTLCKLISGILKPDEGEINVDGRVSALFSLGMGFRGELTGRENVYLNGMMLGIDKEEINKFIDEIHEFSELGTFIDQPMKKYSSGMKARLGFSVAAYLQPEILILDEALNTGDIAFSKKAADKMKELVSKAKMVILVTHSLKYAQKHCDRLIWLEKGVIKDIGDPEEIIKKYKETVPLKKRRKKKPRLNIEKTEAVIRDKSAVKADGVGVSYKMDNETFWALKNINFDIKEGEVVAIIGRNGAGKSTLCKLMTNILTPDIGELTINGDTTALLGYGTGFNTQLSGKDNVYLNGMLLGISQRRVARDYQQIVDFSELDKFMESPIKNYSQGMKARLGFSIAATLKPDVFIIDEALSTGDMSFKRKASTKIQEMMEQAKAVIIVSHSMKFVETVCTRAIWIDKGEIRFDGEAKEAVELYRKEMGIEVKPSKKKTSKKVTKKTTQETGVKV